MRKMDITSKKPWIFTSFQLLFFVFFRFHFSIAADAIFPGQSLSGNNTLTSVNGIFELGFFTPGNSQNYYIGIWYKKLANQTVVWVANRNQPVYSPFSSKLQLLENGNFVLLNQSKSAVWSTNSTSKTPNSTQVVLLDSGNLVIREAMNSDTILWQSFDHPTDHWLPGGKVGINKLTNEKQTLSPWRSPENPAPSLVSMEVEQNGTSHLLLWNGTKVYWSSGKWTGKIFNNVPEIQLNYYITNLTYVSNENESYFTYAANFPSAYTRFLIDVTGQLKQFVFGEDFKTWTLFWTRPTQQCEVYAFCGYFSVCNQQKTPLCDCMEGFEPKSPEDWELEDHTGGCVRKSRLQCSSGGKDAFFVMPNIQFSRENSEPLSEVKSSQDCELACLNNCSCTSFVYDNECLIWKGDLYNLQRLPSDAKAGRDFHLRIASSDLKAGEVPIETKAKGKENTIWIVVGTISGFFVLLGLVLVILWSRRPTKELEAAEGSLTLFKYRELKSATKNFSEKLGEGGFGSVFKGTLPNSTLIAVKQLKSTLKQSEKQFRTEVNTIGTIQHINLVRLRGFCAESSSRFLVYDYMPNGSLESLVFQKAVNVLDWKKRYIIAIGTARGLLYLHEECRDRIIHCDIKPDNILLDAEYNPKVADFGLAKLIGREFSRVLTTMRGTRGYLAPEWLSGEAITPKADVFSYGMLLLEVISGRRNRDLLDDGTDDYFPTRVAKIVNKGENVVSLLDDRLEGKADMEELSRVCKVACWCIQDDEKSRPSMGQVVQILEGFLEVGLPPIPLFLRRLADSPGDAMVYQESSSSSL